MHSGGGRKKEYQPRVTEFATWISEEKNHGHALHKSMIGRKFRALLLGAAERLLRSTKEMTLCGRSKAGLGSSSLKSRPLGTQPYKFMCKGPLRGCLSFLHGGWHGLELGASDRELLN